MAENYERNRSGYSGDRYAAAEYEHSAWRSDWGIHCSSGAPDLSICGRNGTSIYQTATGRGDCGGSKERNPVWL